MKTKYVIIGAIHGFYYFGEEIEAPEGYIRIKNAAMSGGFSGGKGIPGVHRGDTSAKIILDRHEPDTIIEFPVSAVIMIMHNCVNLYEFKGTTLR